VGDSPPRNGHISEWFPWNSSWRLLRYRPS